MPCSPTRCCTIRRSRRAPGPSREGLRCLVCQNQSIDDSDAPSAKDLRLLVRERLKAGDSDQEIIDFVVARYGEFVLLKPRFTPHTLLLWFATPAVLLVALCLIVICLSAAESSARRLRRSARRGTAAEASAGRALKPGRYVLVRQRRPRAVFRQEPY